MDTGLLILSISCLSGFIYLLIGYLLAFEQKADVLNGIDFSRITDISGFCKYVGQSFLISGVVQIFAGVLVYYSGLSLLLFLTIFICFCALPIINVIKAVRKFKKGTA